jgi:hypothetical protein
MRAFSRLGIALVGTALALAPAVAPAQQAPASSTPSEPNAVGPGSLQNFSLSGTVTRPADQPVPQPAAKKPQPKAQAQPAVSATLPSRPARTRVAATPAPARVETQTSQPQPPRTAAVAPPPVASTVALPKLDSAPAPIAAAPPAAAAPDFAPPPNAGGTLAPAHGLGLFPWLLAALVLGAGGAFLFWRNRMRQAVPAGPLFDLFAPLDPASEAPPEPEAAPPPPVRAPEPAGPRAAPAVKPAPAATARVVSSLRPWVEIGFQPLRCILEEHLVRVEFEIELFNSGSSPARAVLAEATLVNAGAAQDEQIANFFAKPAGPGERLPVIPPLKRVLLKNQVFVPREQMQAYELAGRALFVPLIAFNVYYQWSGGDAQTSVSYLLGRDTKGEKLAPFRADLGPRIFRGLAARLLPAGVRD